jgi:hypothetical protein
MKMLRALVVALGLLVPALALAGTAAMIESKADTGGTPNDSDAYTPTASSLQVVFCAVAASTQATATLTNSSGLTFTQVNATTNGGANDRQYVFVADALSTAVSQTVTCDTASDPGNGTNIVVYEITSHGGRFGLDAIKQSDADNGAAASTPGPAFASSVLTGNVTLLGLYNASNPSGMTHPTGWTEGADIAYNTPTAGFEASHRNSGFTGTTVTWNSSSATQWTSLMVEIDNSAGESTPSAFDSAPACTALDEDTYRCAADAGANTATIKYCVLKKDTAAPADGAAVETCTGAVTNGSVAATGASQNIDIDISGDQFPIYDAYFAAKNVTLYGSVQNQLDEVLTAPSGRQYAAKSGSPGVGEEGLFDGASPAIADGDYMDVSSHSDSFLLGADYHCVVVNADTTFEITVTKTSDCSTDSALDNSRQILDRRFYDVSVGDWSDASPVEAAIGDQAPTFTGLDDLEGTIDPYLFEKDAVDGGLVTELFSDPEGDTMTLAVSGNGTISGGNSWVVDSDTCGEFTPVIFTATDSWGEDTASDSVMVTIGDLVPDVLSDDEATATASIEALCSFVATASAAQYSESIAEGLVVSTDPEAGELVPFDQVVTYSLSLGPDTLNPDVVRKVVFILDDITNLTRWVDYIPVSDVPGCRTGTYESDGCMAVDVIASSAGLTAWVDYIPVYEVSQTDNKWRYENDGWIPVDTLTP